VIFFLIPLCPRSTVIVLETVRDPTKPEGFDISADIPSMLSSMSNYGVQAALCAGTAPRLDAQRVRQLALGAETITHYDGKIRYKSICFPYPDSAPDVSCILWMLAIARCVWWPFVPLVLSALGGLQCCEFSTDLIVYTFVVTWTLFITSWCCCKPKAS
jgi:hypothetical protein